MKTVLKIKIAVIIAALFSAPILANATEVILPGKYDCTYYSSVKNVFAGFGKKTIYAPKDQLNLWYASTKIDNQALLSHILVDPTTMGFRGEPQDGVRVEYACSTLTPVIKIWFHGGVNQDQACTVNVICDMRPVDEMQVLVENARCLDGSSDLEQANFCRSEEFITRVKQIPPTHWLDAPGWPK